MTREQQLTIRVERVDDVPLLLGHMERMGLAEEIDRCFRPHGNWGQDLSLGQTTVVWLAYLISQGDHRMSRVEEWAEDLQVTLQRSVSPALRPTSVADDRPARVLRYLAQDEAWARLEDALNRRLIRVYALPTERVRVDMSTVSTYARVTSGGLVQFGFSKDHRPDLPQVKVALATLDPPGMPIRSLVVPGNRADDPCYVPLMQRAHEVLGAGLPYVGDGKMAAAATRATVHRQGDMYLCPAPRTVVSEETLAAYLEEAKAEGRIARWEWEQAEGTTVKGEAFVVEVPMEVNLVGEAVAWTEERRVVRSEAGRARAVRQLEKRLAQAETALRALNARGRGKRRYRTREALVERVEAILARYEVGGLLAVRYRGRVEERRKRGYRGRPGRVERQEDWFVDEVQRDEAALAERRERLGWRVYLTNGKVQGHPLQATDVVRAYRGQYTVERAFHRMKDRPVGITPMDVHRDDHRKGLARLFLLALRVVTVLEYEARRSLAQTGKVLYGLYAGNPKRGTVRPTAERLPEAFKGVPLTLARWENQRIHHVTPLSALQKDILHLLGLSEDLYTSLAAQLDEPP